ncbi:osomolarity two-component system, phosphorelay intermediate protein YPD1 [Blastomyces silverae]|uniref:Osomolarity two-component system, phosphorelay intermediate protein YPD1 n=1 Tax=Blastomyces silverae TaxID=2060906 RepID=A0A0H1BB60_9EURO|nr:osomolarity two-component system, phosphorelay intermediate protein YPD1 [Blastomyces silverae]
MPPSATTQVPQQQQPPQQPPQQTTTDKVPDLASLGDHIEETTFEQILEMDEDFKREFSRDLVYRFFEQAETTFSDMEDAIDEKDLYKIYQLGHFLKGSSASLGLSKVKEACEKIQNLGGGKDESGTVNEPNKDVSLANIKKTLNETKKDYKDAVVRLKRFYGEKV